jgi:hypothetical protein
MAEFGLSWPEMAGAILLGTVFVTLILVVAFVAGHYKGRSSIAWGLIAAAAQIIALLLPVSIIALTGLADPREMLITDGRLEFSTLRLFAEMSVVAGITTLGVLGFLTQTKWKFCPACDAQIPWRAKTCPQCASSQTESPITTARLEPGAYPRLKARTIHLPVELDEQLKRTAHPLKKRLSMTEDAAISQYVRQLLEELNGASKPPEQKEK